MANWSLTTYSVDGSTALPAILRADGAVVVPDVLRPYDGLKEALAHWDVLAPVLADIDPDLLVPIDGGRAEVTVKYPNKLICVGANYNDHITEMEGASVPAGWQPFFILVPPTTTLIASGDTIVIPPDPAQRIDWEAEVALVIGRGGRDITVEDAAGHIAGYACFSDITARGMLRRAETIAEPFRWDWTGSKGMDTFCPMGPMTPGWMVPDPTALGIRCLVNGVLKQNGSTTDLVSSFAEIVAAASRNFTLEPGDVIATGTPAGVGAPHGERLQDGDEVRVEVTGLAPLTNPVRVRAQAASNANAVEATAR